MNILVIEGQNSNDEEVKLVKSRYVICPQCYENAFISIKDFNISIVGCKSGHKTENIQLNEFSKTQFVDQSKIKCDKCQIQKAEIPNNKFFVCNTCNQNICPKCKDEHDKSHLAHIINYDENQFYCNTHTSPYICYCEDCKKELCDACHKDHNDPLDDEIKELELDLDPEDQYQFGQDHNFIFYDTMIPDIDNIKNNDLKDTKEKIYKLKLIINEMINRLNQLNKNLNNYFEIFNDIISNFDTTKKNYSTIQNVNTIKKYNDNFLGYISEIIKDNNIKSQFTNIISLQSKIDLKNLKNNNLQIEENEIHEIKVENNIIENYNIEKYNPADDTYENFDINNIKEIQSYNTKNEVDNLLILNDGRIMTLQPYGDETRDVLYKLCVYSVNKGFVCDINIDFDAIFDFYSMDDGNIITYTKKEKTKIFKIEKKDVKEIWVYEKNALTLKKLSNDIIFINTITSE